MADRHRLQRGLDPTLGSFRDWTTTLRLDPVLVTPVRHLWRDYLAHCRDWGFPAASPSIFVRRLEAMRGVRVDTGGRGRIRRMAHGVASGQ